MPEELRMCPDCGVPKPLTAFWKNGHSHAGRLPRCGACAHLRRVRREGREGARAELLKMRTWAKANGFPVKDFGFIGAEVRKAYLAARGGRSFPLDDLLRVARLTFDGLLTAIEGIATPDEVARWGNGVPEALADRVAVACGLHPLSVWGQAWEDACPEEDEAA